MSEDDEIRPAPAAGADATRTSADLLEHLADKLGARAGARAVFGEPVTAGGVTVIPVAEAAFGFGGGSGTGRDVKAARTGGGGGGGAGARPRGFIVIADGTAASTPVRHPWADVVLPAAAFVTGLAAGRLLRSRTDRR